MKKCIAPSRLLLLLFWAFIGTSGDDILKDDDSEDDFDFFPVYTYRYNVYDPLTDDFKSVQESRTGDVVKGFYAVKDADGTIREVHYTADAKNGFRAAIRRNGGPLQYFPGPAPQPSSAFR